MMVSFSAGDADAAPPGLGFIVDGGFYKDSAPTELGRVKRSARCYACGAAAARQPYRARLSTLHRHDEVLHDLRSVFLPM